MTTITREQAIDKLVEYDLEAFLNCEDYLGQVLRHGEIGFEQMDLEELQDSWNNRFEEQVTITEIKSIC
jgi:hypothetical protein